MGSYWYTKENPCVFGLQAGLWALESHRQAGEATNQTPGRQKEKALWSSGALEARRGGRSFTSARQNPTSREVSICLAASPSVGPRSLDQWNQYQLRYFRLRPRSLRSPMPSDGGRVCGARAQGCPGRGRNSRIIDILSWMLET